MKRSIAVGALLMASTFLVAQDFPFRIGLKPVEIPGLPGLQSYAWATHDDKWLIIGGRKDGLHRRQPFAAFDQPGQNDLVWVIDPAVNQWWSAPLAGLPIALQEQFRSTNMVFQQEGDWLHLAGGYGFSPSLGDHTTFPYWSVIDVPKVMDAIQNGKAFHTYVRHLASPSFAVTGGHLDRIGELFYMVGGQYFEGRYNPMGPDHGPGFIQKYTDEIRRFAVEVSDQQLEIKQVSEWKDSLALHRRDYNVVATMLADGREGLTAFSGVFQPDVDVPFLDCVHIDSSGYQVQPGFSQYYNHYHCANLPMYSAADHTMHTVFFGGIAQYYDSLGVLVQDNDVPFVRTIARVSRMADGSMGEYRLGIEMPSLLGAGSEFIPVSSVPRYSNGVLRLDEIPEDSVLIGHIFGGIESSAPNIFFVNNGGESWASNTIYEVWMDKEAGSAIDALNPQSRGSLAMQVIPNPAYGDFAVRFHLQRSAEVRLIITDAQGVAVFQEDLEGAVLGGNTFAISLNRVSGQGVYFVTLDAGYEKSVQKIILNP